MTYGFASEARGRSSERARVLGHGSPRGLVIGTGEFSDSPAVAVVPLHNDVTVTRAKPNEFLQRLERAGVPVLRGSKQPINRMALVSIIIKRHRDMLRTIRSLPL